MPDEARAELEALWFTLTRETLPAQANDRNWLVRLDHCFQRILLDNACGGPWREHIDPPAYRNAPDPVLLKAVELGHEVIAGGSDLAEMNRRSLQWRDKLRSGDAARSAD